MEVNAAQSASALHACLAAHGPFDVIADDTRSAQTQISLFRRVFFHLAPGGAFVLRTPRHKLAAGEGLKRFLVRILQAQAIPGEGTVKKRRYDVTLAESIGDLVVKRRHLVVTSKVRALAKMREAEINTVLAQRAGASGKILDKRAGVTWASRCDIRMSASTCEPRMPKSYDAPDVFMREYYDVVCLPRQVAVQENLILPDSYRHHQAPRLKHDFTYDFSPRFARPTADESPAKTLPGAYFYLDSEFPGHFGHTMTEQLSRLWAWQQAKMFEPELKVLRSLRRPGTSIAAHELEIFQAVGIDAADVVSYDAAVKVERLIAATPMFSMPEYVHPDIREVWNPIGRRLAMSAPRRDYPKRIFCARRTTKRQCRNATAVELVFASHGFQVIYPEDFPLAEQVAMFRNADTVAGYSGSALFTLAFCESPKTVIMIASETYTARNEYMICSVLGHQLTVLWCRPDEPQAENNWARPRFSSAFTFDFGREGLLLTTALASL